LERKALRKQDQHDRTISTSLDGLKCTSLFLSPHASIFLLSQILQSAIPSFLASSSCLSTWHSFGSRGSQISSGAPWRNLRASCPCRFLWCLSSVELVSLSSIRVAYPRIIHIRCLGRSCHLVLFTMTIPESFFKPRAS
jgi:hypothetical protein